MTASKPSTRRTRNALQSWFFRPFSGLFDKHEQLLEGFRATAGNGKTRRSFPLFVERLETREVLSSFYTSGDLVVVQVGSGATTPALSSAATAAFLQEYTTSGALVSGATVNLPTADSGSTHALTLSGTLANTSAEPIPEGLLADSTDGYFLTVAGYDTTTGSTASVTSSAAPRTVALIGNPAGGSSASVNTSTIITDSYSKAAIRAAGTNDDQSFYVAGASSGVHYVSLGSTGTTTTISTTFTSPYAIQIANGQLYTDGNATNLGGPAAVGTGLPTTTGQVTSPLPGFLSTADAFGKFPNPTQFIFDGPNIVYVADSRLDGLGGISKWVLSGGTWAQEYQQPIGGSSGPGSGLIGLVGDFSNPSQPVLYGTTTSPGSSVSGSSNSIVLMVDTGSSFTISTIATAPTNTVFRGIAFAPNPGVATNTVVTSTSNPANPNTNITLTATVTATSGTATGSVVFFDNGVALSGAITLPAGSGVATFGTSTLAIGTNVISAIYTPQSSSNFIQSTSPAFNETISGPLFTGLNNTVFTSGQTGQSFQLTSTTGATYAAGTPAPPSWVTISSAGVISGTPPVVTQTTPVTFGVTTTDINNFTNTEQFTIYDVPQVTPPTPFTPGDLLVYRVGGNGATYGSTGSGGTASGVAASVFLDEYSPNGNFVESVAIPSSSNSGAVESISTPTDGMIELSADGRLVTFTGYANAPGTANITGTATSSTTAANARVIGTVNANGAVTTSLTTLAYSGNAINGAVSVNGTQFWTAGFGGSGTNAGVQYYPTASASLVPNTQQQVNFQTTFNIRAVSIYDGQLFWSTNNTFSSGAGVYYENPAAGAEFPTPPTVTVNGTAYPGTPSTDSNKAAGSPAPDQFVVLNLDGGNTLDSSSVMYIADNSSGTFGLYKSLGSPVNGGELWTVPTLIANNVNLNGLTGTVVSGTPVLYGTSATDKLGASTSFSTSIVTLSDPLPASTTESLTWSPLANPVSFSNVGSTAAPISQLLGIAFVPQTPGPVSPGMSLSVTGTPPPTAGNTVLRSEAVTLNANFSALSTQQPNWVSFEQNGTTIATVQVNSSGMASFTIPGNTLPIGANTYTVFFGGNNTNNSSTQNITIHVIAIQTNTTVQGSPAAPHVGTIVTLTATITFTGTGTPTGDVTFMDNQLALGTLTGSPLVEVNPTTYQASLTLMTTATQVFGDLTPGLHGITATYSGDSNFTNSAGTTIQTVEANPFGSGDVLVYRNGDGVNPLTSTSGGNAVYVDEYLPVGSSQTAPVQSIAFPTLDSGTTHSLISDSQQSVDGQVSLSGNGQYVFLEGYDASPTTSTQLHFASATVVPRTIGVIKYDGTVESGVALTDVSSGATFNGVYSPDGNQFYATGYAGEVRYVSSYTPSATTQTSTQIDTGVNGGNLQLISVGAAGDQLYVSSNSGGSVKIGAVGSGMPTTSGQTITPLAGIPLGGGNVPIQPIAFYFTKLSPTSTGPDTLYIADDGSNFNNGSISKWTLNPTTGLWNETGEIDANGGTLQGFDMMTGETVGNTVTLFMTYGNGGNSNVGIGLLYSVTDTTGYGGNLNSSSGATPTILASTGSTSEENLRGVSLVPVAPQPTVSFNIVAPSHVTAGTSFKFTVSAQDTNGNTVTAYNGTVHFTTNSSSLLPPGLPINATLTGGVGSFTATLYSVGSATITVNDTVQSALTTPSGTITIVPAAANHYVIAAPTSVQRGQSFRVTVTAQDQFGNTITNYPGSVQLFSTDSTAVLSPSSTLSGGTGTFSATLNGSGNQTLIAYDTVSTSITGSSAPISITNPPTHFAVSAPAASAAGNLFVFEVSALDQSNSIAPGYSGTVLFTSSDSQGSFSTSSATLNGGIGFFAADLKTAGAETIFATDSVTSSISGSSSPISITAIAASHFVVTPAAAPNFPGVPAAYPTTPGAATSFVSTGSPAVFSVVAEDPYNNLATSYAGTVGFSSSDLAAILPVNGTLAAGVGSFSATLQTAGNQVISVSDVNSPTIAGTSSALVARGLVVTSFAPTPSGFVVTFNKPFNISSVALYTQAPAAIADDVILTTTNSQVSVRGSLLVNANDTSITFVKTNNITGSGTFNPANGLLAAGNYTLTLRSLVSGNGFQDNLAPLDGTDTGGHANYGITFSVAALPVAVGIPDFARGPSNTDAVFLPSTLSNGSTFNLTYTNPSANPTTGTATVTFSTTLATLQANIQTALTSGGLANQVGVNASANNTPNSVVIVTTDTSSGANVLVTFQSALATTTSQVLGSTTTGVTAALATINVANNIPGDGIPIALSNGNGVTSGSFTLQYNPALLAITGAVSKVAGASFTLVSNNTVTGTAVLSLSSPTALLGGTTTGAVTMGSLLATVPLGATASYGAKQLVHFSSEQLAGTKGTITLTNADGIEVAAYFGNATDTGGPLNLGDAGAIASVAGAIANTVTQTIPGFSSFPQLDPAIIGDVSLQGSVTSTDAGAMTQQVGGTARPTIPYAPIGLTVNPVGPDPTLSVAGGQWLDGGGTLLVPVDIDTARPQGSMGMVDAVLALSYDPKVFEVTAADVQLGTVPGSGSGWQLKSEVNAQTGLIGVELVSSTPMATTAGGSLVTVALQVRPGEATAVSGYTQGSPLTIVPYVDPTGGMRVFHTQVSDGQGAYVLEVDNGGVVDGGQRTVEGGRAPGGASQASVAPVVDAPSANLLPMAAMEQMLGGTEHASLVVQDSALIQPGIILTTAPNDQTPSQVRDLAAVQGSVGTEPSEWLTEDWLAALGQPTSQGLGMTRSGATQDGLIGGMDELDLAGLDAYFAREGAGGSSARIS
jgi:hypothetical protein